MKKRKVSEDIVGILEEKLKKKNIKYSLSKEEGTCFVESDLNGRQFHTLISESRCIQQRNGKKTNVKSIDSLINGFPMESFIVLQQNVEKVLQLCD